MAINLKKGQEISLTKEAPGLTRVMCGLGWDVTKTGGGGFLGIFGGGQNFDIDASVICLDANDKLINSRGVVYFGNLRHSSGAITHLGDNLTGAGEGDDEEILIDLPMMPENIAKLAIVVNIYQAMPRNQDFGKVNNAFVRLVNLENRREIVRYNLSGSEYQGKTGTIMAEIYRQNNEWKMSAIGKGIQVKDLKEILRIYQ